MTFFDVFASADVIVAVLVFSVLALGEPFVESSLHSVFAANPPFQWGWDQLSAPLLRAIMLVVFVYLAFPTLFGLNTAPSIGELISSQEMHVPNVLGILFLIGFLASLAPGLGGKPEFVLPVQGCLACGYLFFGLTGYLGVTTANLWPGIDILLTMVCVSYYAHRFGRFVGEVGGDQLDMMLNTRGYGVVVLHVIELLAQVPIILLFGHGLGRQLAI